MATQQITPQQRADLQRESLNRAVSGQSLANYPAIFEGFEAMGIPADDIKPRENVFTFNAWKALGRSVKKGEHGVKVVTWVTAKGERVEATEAQAAAGGFRFPKTTTVFHVSQTEVRN